MERICGFYVSNIHFLTMILPFLKEQMQNDDVIETFFEHNLSEGINKILFNLILNENSKQKILNINWKNTKLKRYGILEKRLKELLSKNKENIILVCGNKHYVNSINNILNKFLENNNYKRIKIINCFQVTEFDDNIAEILENHKYIINTAGIHKIEDVFEDYKKEKVN